MGKPVPENYFKIEELYHAPAVQPKPKSTKKINDAHRTIVEAGSEMQKALRTLLYIIQTKRNERKLKGERLNPADERVTPSTETIVEKPPSLKNVVSTQNQIKNIFSAIRQSIASVNNDGKIEKQSNDSEIAENAFCSLQKVVSGVCGKTEAIIS